MKIYRYNLEFEKFHEGILKIALELRNKEFVRKNMVYSRYITWDEHLKWYSELNPETNFYFLIRSNHIPVGVFNFKDLDIENKRAELGIFMGREDILRTPVPFLCCLTLIDLAVKLFQISPFTKVKTGASDIESLNKSLGYELAETHEHYIVNNLNIEKHYQLSKKVRKAADVLFPNNNQSESFKIQINEEDADDNSVKFLIHLYESLRPENKNEFILTD